MPKRQLMWSKNNIWCGGYQQKNENRHAKGGDFGSNRTNQGNSHE
jgi:hypothetical protein